jgi:hypothetical protein
MGDTPGRPRNEANLPLVAEAPAELQHFGGVDGGEGVGTGDDGGDAPRRRRKTRRAEGFLVPLARFANLDADVDDAGGQGMAAAVDHTGRFRGCAIDGDNQPAVDGQRARGIRPGLGVDQAGIG